MAKETSLSILVFTALRNHQRSLSGIELQVMCQLTERQVRMAISALRHKGCLVVGNWNGYHFAKSCSEVEQVALELDDQARRLSQTAEAMRKAMREDLSLNR